MDDNFAKEEYCPKRTNLKIRKEGASSIWRLRELLGQNHRAVTSKISMISCSFSNIFSVLEMITGQAKSSFNYYAIKSEMQLCNTSFINVVVFLITEYSWRLYLSRSLLYISARILASENGNLSPLFTCPSDISAN